MPFIRVIWDDPEDPEGNVQHIAEHGLTMDEVDFVLANPSGEATSQTSGRPCCFGRTPSGEYIIVVYEKPDDVSFYPMTAYQVPEP